MHTQLTDTMPSRVAAIARTRGVALTAEQLDGYSQALAGARVTLDEAWDAHMALWVEDDSRGMPSPAKLIDRVKRARRELEVLRAQVDAKADGDIPEDEHRFGLEASAILGQLLSGEISLREAEQRQDAAARQILGPDALRRYLRAAHEARP